MRFGFLSLYRTLERKNMNNVSDLDILKNSHKFVDSTCDDKVNWGERMARKYESKLFKDFAIVDLSQNESFGLRWRTRQEILLGKGEMSCCSKYCSSSSCLSGFELPFKYVEDNAEKVELVKVVLCEQCSTKLFLFH